MRHLSALLICFYAFRVKYYLVLLLLIYTIWKVLFTLAWVIHELRELSLENLLASIHRCKVRRPQRGREEVLHSLRMLLVVAWVLLPGCDEKVILTYLYLITVVKDPRSAVPLLSTGFSNVLDLALIQLFDMFYLQLLSLAVGVWFIGLPWRMVLYFNLFITTYLHINTLLVLP